MTIARGPFLLDEVRNASSWRIVEVEQGDGCHSYLLLAESSRKSGRVVGIRGGFREGGLFRFIVCTDAEGGRMARDPAGLIGGLPISEAAIDFAAFEADHARRSTGVLLRGAFAERR